MKSDKPAGVQGPRRAARWGLMAAGSSFLCAALSGCAPAPLHIQSAVFSGALAPVIDQSAQAYRGAIAVHDQREDYEAVVAYENKDASYNPRSASPFMTEKDVQTRLAVLAALQVYSQSLIQITEGTASPQLDQASASVGDQLASVGQALSPSFESVLGIAGPASTTSAATVSAGTTVSASTTASAPALSPQVRNGISAGINALGQFLVSRKIAKELPAQIVQMDSHIETLCETMVSDTQAIRSLEGRDYDRMLDLEKQFILEDQAPGTHANPEMLRAEIMKLPQIARRQREANERLEALQSALVNLAMTHHALAAEAQGNNPAALKEKLSELAEAGKKLGDFYSSLPAQ